MHKILIKENGDVLFIDLTEKWTKQKVTSAKVRELIYCEASDRSYNMPKKYKDFLNNYNNNYSPMLTKYFLESKLTKTQMAKRLGITTETFTKLLYGPILLDDKFKRHMLKKAKKIAKEVNK